MVHGPEAELVVVGAFGQPGQLFHLGGPLADGDDVDHRRLAPGQHPGHGLRVAGLPRQAYRFGAQRPPLLEAGADAQLHRELAHQLRVVDIVGLWDRREGGPQQLDAILVERPGVGEGASGVGEGGLDLERGQPGGACDPCRFEQRFPEPLDAAVALRHAEREEGLGALPRLVEPSPRQVGERDLVPPRSGEELEGRHGLVAGPPRRTHRPRRLRRAEQRGLGGMMGQVGRLGDAELLQALGQLVVDARAAHGGESIQHDSSHQRMDEPVLGGRPDLLDEAGRDRLVQSVEQLPVGVVDLQEEHRIEALAGHRRQLQETLHRCRARRHPAQDHLSERLRQGEPIGRCRSRPSAVGALQDPGFDQMGEQLRGVQRIASRLLVQGGRHFRGLRVAAQILACGGGQETEHARLVEAMERDVLAPLEAG